MQIAYDNKLVKIAVADDHCLFRESICAMINTWENCKVILQAANGCQLIERLDVRNLPDLALIDIAMPEMNGFETIKAIKEKYPEIKQMGLSFYNSEEVVWQLIKCGAQGFVNKNDDINRLKKAIAEMMHTGYFFSDHAASKMIKMFIQTGTLSIKNDISEKEISFLKHISTEKTYKEIADEMGISERQTEYIRNCFFERYNIKSRTALAMLAMEKGLII